MDVGCEIKNLWNYALLGNRISILRNSDLDLDHRHLGYNPKLPLDISYPDTKFGVKRQKETCQSAKAI